MFVRAFGFGVKPGGGQGIRGLHPGDGCRPGTPGGGAGQLSFSSALATDDAGNAYVADTANSRVSQFTTDGDFVRAFGLDVVPGGGKEFEICTIATGCKRGPRDGVARGIPSPLGGGCGPERLDLRLRRRGR